MQRYVSIVKKDMHYSKTNALRIALMVNEKLEFHLLHQKKTGKPEKKYFKNNVLIVLYKTVIIVQQISMEWKHARNAFQMQRDSLILRLGLLNVLFLARNEHLQVNLIVYNVILLARH
jgi:uncharacterized protein YbbC (DUF1343 family)